MKKSILRAMIMLSVLALAGGVQAANTIAWDSSTNNVYDHLGVIIDPQIAADSSLEGPGLSGLIQLVYAGPNGTADYAYAASSIVGGVFSGTIGTGVFTNGQAVDDVVVAYQWIGFGKSAATSPGAWSVTGVNSYTNDYTGGKFFVRVWELPGVNSNNIPTNAVGTKLYYGNSPLYQSSSSDVPVAESFHLANNFNTTSSLTVVPEPGALSLLLIFGSALFARMRLRKSAG